ncbi:MAG: ice-binding family protein [Marmoricola sp.]
MSRARSFHHISARSGSVRVASGTCVLLVLGLLVAMSPASAAPPQAAAPVNLGTAAGFSVLAGPSIANTGAATVLALDLGVTGTLAGFPPGIVNGTQHVADDAAATAQDDRQAAYAGVVAQTGGTAFGGDLAGQTFTPGLYTTAAAVTNTGTITLDAAGDPSAIFVFQVGAALSSAAAGKVVLTGGALAHNVYWQVVGAVALGAGVKWVGTLLGAGVVSLGEGASLKGRILTPSTVALANSPVTKPIDDLVAPLVSLDGGATRSTNDTTPPISGTTDEPGTPLVKVTIGAQVLTTRADSGTWTVSANALTPGSHDVVASVTDPSQNTGTAPQALRVDTSAPGVTITGGSAAATKDTTPTISGTTDEPGAPRVAVTVGGQELTTTAGAGGAWTVEATALTETSHSVQASVGDDAGNTGTAGQVLTVDVTVPVLTIDGGPRRSTSDTSPWTYGTTAEKAGTIVRVSVGGQSLTATVQPGGTWGVSAQTLAGGTHTVLASITDAAQNTGTATQALTVGAGTPPVDPPVNPPVDPPVNPPVNPPAAAKYRPDAQIRLAPGAFVGAGSYDATRQRVTSRLKGRPVRTAVFEVRMTNRGNASDQMTLRGTSRSAQLAVAYLYGRTNVTTAVLNGTFRTGSLKAGQTTTLTVRVTKVRRARIGSSRAFPIRVASVRDRTKADTVAAVAVVVRG